MISSDAPIAFVTGTSSGFGLLASVVLANQGYRVIASMRDTSNATNLLESAKAAGVQHLIEIVQLDITDITRVNLVVEGVIKRFGQIDVLVNNAGYAAGGFVEEVTMETWRNQFETNFFGTVAVTRAVLPHMRERHAGTIVNMSSISGRIGFPGLGPYVSSKFALEGFSESLRLEMLPYGVHVVLIEPASYKTNIWAKGLASTKVQDNSPYLREMQWMVQGIQQISESAGNPQEVADLLTRVVKLERPALRYPIGKGVLRMLALKAALPWNWIEALMMKRFKR